MESSHMNVTDINAVGYLLHARKFHFIGEIGNGSYGEVLHIYDDGNDIHKAIKVVESKKVRELEERIWAKLHHENILPLEETIKMPNNTLIFIMPLKFRSLFGVVSDDKFRRYPYSHKVLKRWLRDTLLGLKYLHDKNYCHLDLKIDNVLVGFDGKAVICDFSFIFDSFKVLTADDVGLPIEYKPPETFEHEYKQFETFEVEYKESAIFEVEHKQLETFEVEYKEPTIFEIEHKQLETFEVDCKSSDTFDAEDIQTKTLEVEHKQPEILEIECKQLQTSELEYKQPETSIVEYEQPKTSVPNYKHSKSFKVGNKSFKAFEAEYKQPKTFKVECKSLDILAAQPEVLEEQYKSAKNLNIDNKSHETLKAEYKPHDSLEMKTKRRIVGTAVDIWAFGILVVELFTNAYISYNAMGCSNWNKEIQSFLKTLLRYEIFERVVRHEYPAFASTQNELQNILEFAVRLLKVRPEKRMPIHEALLHDILKDVENFVVELGVIYSEKDSFVVVPEVQNNSDGELQTGYQKECPKTL